MEQAILSLLISWGNFYVILGSSASALTGLQFVVITLGAEVDVLSTPTIRAFGTPTIVHFCAVLFISVIISAPWPTISSAGLCLDACGLAGLTYTVLVARRVRRQTDYVPVLEDWLWHCALPFIAYAVLLTAANILWRYPVQALFVIGATAVFLLFVGIHNAWDAVIYIALERRQRPKRTGDKD